MTKRQGLSHKNVTIAIVVVVMEVASAEAGAVDCNLEFVGLWW